MSEQVTYAGHLREGCKGRWVDISALSGSAWMCPDCRAVVPDPEALDPVTISTPPEEPIGPRNPRVGQLLAVLVGILLVGLALLGKRSLDLILSLWPW
jgi:hypothetical protein